MSSTQYDSFTAFPAATAFCRKIWHNMTPGRMHAERPSKLSPLKLIAHYFPSAPSRGFKFLKQAMFGRPFFYSHFAYEEKGKIQVCSRDELCTAYAELVAQHDRLAHRTLGMLAAVKFLKHAEGRDLTNEEHHELENQLMERYRALWVQSKRAERRLDSALTHFAHYLKLLSESEDSGRLPPPWVSYPREITVTSARFPEKLPLVLDDARKMEDFVFRAAKIINTSEPPAELLALHRGIEDLTVEVLNLKGYSQSSTKVYQLDSKTASLTTCIKDAACPVNTCPDFA